MKMPAIIEKNNHNSFSRSVYLGTFFSMAVLIFELMLTRLFSVTLYYHMAFLIISLVMLGLCGNFTNAKTDSFSWSSYLYGLTCVLFTLLLSSGLGSLSFWQWRQKFLNCGWSVLFIVASLLVLAFFTPPLFSRFREMTAFGRIDMLPTYYYRTGSFIKVCSVL